jgi:hypothetical protein
MRESAAMTSAAMLATSGSAMSAGRATALRSNPMAQLTAVVITTAIRTPGQRGRNFLKPSISVKAASPIASVGKWVSPICCSTSHMS